MDSTEMIRIDSKLSLALYTTPTTPTINPSDPSHAMQSQHNPLHPPPSRQMRIHFGLEVGQGGADGCACGGGVIGRRVYSSVVG